MRWARGSTGSPDGRAIQADVDLQRGRYGETRRANERLVAETHSWADLARLAHLERTLGDPDRADALYAEAADEITAKELRQYAWVEVQRGLLRLRHGRLAAAEHHYERAEAAYSGYWVVDEHTAELRAAQGRIDEAIALYEGAALRAGRPELAQAVGDLHRHAGTDRVAAWHERALADTLIRRPRRGAVHHHLAEYYADVEHDGAPAVNWAERDHALRPHYATEMALAWAYHGRAGTASMSSRTRRLRRVSATRTCSTRRVISTAAGRRRRRAPAGRGGALNPAHHTSTSIAEGSFMAANGSETLEVVALVCYGGVSLAIYMSGITREIQELVTVGGPRRSGTRARRRARPMHGP